MIITIRGQRVILDSDLAAIYGVSTKRLNEQVKRNEDRFPADFAFQLTMAEKGEVVANCDHLRRLKFSPVLPRAFTEHGVIMAANVLNSQRAVGNTIPLVGGRGKAKYRRLKAKVKGALHENAMFPAEAVDPSEGTECFCLGVLSLVRNGRAWSGRRSMLAWPRHSWPKNSPGVPVQMGTKGGSGFGFILCAQELRLLWA